MQWNAIPEGIIIYHWWLRASHLVGYLFENESVREKMMTEVWSMEGSEENIDYID